MYIRLNKYILNTLTLIKETKMKKIIVTIAFLALSTISAKAIDFSNFEVTAGIAHNEGVFGATARERNENQSGVVVSDKKESGVFTEGYSSYLIELGIGQYVSLGYEHTPDSVSTPSNTSRVGNAAGTNTVSVDFNDLNTTYVKLNLPIFENFYAKYGLVSTDLDIRESMGSASTYSNVSTDGTTMGLGYDRQIKETGFGFRFETSYLELDNVTTNNGVAAGTVSTTNAASRNQVDASNLEGLTAKVALTYTFGRN